MVRPMQANQDQDIVDSSFSTFLENCDSQPIWETIIDIGAEITDEEWSKIPPDLSKTIDS